jgi:hypothetical protein
MKIKHVIPCLLCILIPILIVVRAKLIYSEGPRIIQKLEAYKKIEGSYPAALDAAKAKSSFYPRYYYNQTQGSYILLYSIFAYRRWCYDSRTQSWMHLD